MTPEVDYQDDVTVYEPGLDGYGNDVKGASHDMKGLFVQIMGRLKAGGPAAIVSQSQLHLPGDNAYLASVGYRLEGMVVKINPFGGPAGDQYFRIVEVTPTRDVLLGNDVHNVECLLDKVGDFKS